MYVYPLSILRRFTHLALNGMLLRMDKDIKLCVDCKYHSFWMGYHFCSQDDVLDSVANVVLREPVLCEIARLNQSDDGGALCGSVGRYWEKNVPYVGEKVGWFRRLLKCLDH